MLEEILWSPNFFSEWWFLVILAEFGYFLVCKIFVEALNGLNCSALVCSDLILFDFLRILPVSNFFSRPSFILWNYFRKIVLGVKNEMFYFNDFIYKFIWENWYCHNKLHGKYHIHLLARGGSRNMLRHFLRIPLF